MLRKILRNYEIPKKIGNVTAVIYSSSKKRVRLGEKLIEAFHITTGVLQSDTLAPFLFIIVWDYILNKSLRIAFRLFFYLRLFYCNRCFIDIIFINFLIHYFPGQIMESKHILLIQM